MIWACRGRKKIGQQDKEVLEVVNTASDERRRGDSGWKKSRKGQDWQEGVNPLVTENT